MPDRYSAKLLFSYDDGRDLVRPLCEERIVTFESPTPAKAVQRAHRRGRESEYRFTNSCGDEVRFWFVGVVDMIRLGVEAENDEVWYAVTRKQALSENACPTTKDLQSRLKRD